MKAVLIHLKHVLLTGITAVVAAFIFTSCQKVINVDLNTANPQIVILGYVTDQPGIDTVRIVKTGSYFNPGNYPNVNGALVVITDNTGLTDTLVQVDSGVYAASPNMTGVPGRTYTMKALINGKQYLASSTMPSPVNIDSIQVYPIGLLTDSAGIAVNDSTFHVRCYYRDPTGAGHFYRLQSVINGVAQDSLDDITIESNEFDEGTEFDIRLRGILPLKGQLVTVQLMCIDQGTYNYYNVVKSIASEGNPVSTAVPQNPPTNIAGGAIGYFSAYTLRSESEIAP